MNSFRITPSLMIVLGIGSIFGGTIQGCGLADGGPILGDVAMPIQFENRTNETILVISRYDGEDSFSPSVRLPPHTVEKVPYMIRRTGVQIRGMIIPSNKVVLDRHILWKQFKPDDRVIVIDEESSTPTATPIKDRT